VSARCGGVWDLLCNAELLAQLLQHVVRMFLSLRFFFKWVEWSIALGALKIASLLGPCQAV